MRIAACRHRNFGALRRRALHFLFVATAGSGEETIELFRRHQPDVALMDLRLPGQGALPGDPRYPRWGTSAYHPKAPAADEVLNFLAEKGKTAKYVTSVCTGALILGAAGLLRGYKATSYKQAKKFIDDMFNPAAKSLHETALRAQQRLEGGAQK